MPKRSENQNTLALGEWNAECDVCGFKFKACDLRQRWDGMMVCEDDYEERHPMDFFRGVEEQNNVEYVIPMSEQGADNSSTDVAGNTFPDTSDPQGTLTAVPSGTFDGSL